MKNAVSRKLNRGLSILLALALLVSMFVLSGCASSDREYDKTILCVGFAEYDWVRNIVPDGNPGGLKVEILNKTGADMHSFQPSVDDMVRLVNSRLVIFNDGISESWLRDISKSEIRGEHVSLMDIFLSDTEGYDILEKEALQGEDHEDELVDEVDEHIFLSLEIAKRIVLELAQKISSVDGANREYYLKNAEAYIAKLDALSKEYASISKAHECFVLDRYPFTYLFQDYGWTEQACFSGCSTDSEAKFDTIVEMAKRVSSVKPSAVIILDNAKPDLATTILDAAKQKDIEIVNVNSLQSVSDMSATYLGLMEGNLKAFKKALN